MSYLPPSSRKLRGAGDVVHFVAQPVAKAIDAVAGTHLQTCGGCKRRREKLNQILPMKTKIILLFLTLALAAGGQTNLVVSNFVGTVDTSWTGQVIPKLNYNNGQIVQWLNALNSTNACEDAAISNLNTQIGTNIYFLLSSRTNGVFANGRNYTNLWGTNIVTGTLPTNAFASATMVWLESLPAGSFPDIADSRGVVALSGGLEINTNNAGDCGITNNQGSLDLVMNHDANGNSILHLWNRNDCDGAAFENPSDGEVDFNFFGATLGYSGRFNIRDESRYYSEQLQANDPAFGGAGEFEFLNPGSAGGYRQIFTFGPAAVAVIPNMWFNATQVTGANDNAGPQYPIDMANSGLIGESDNGNTTTIQLDDGSGNMTLATPGGQQNFTVSHGTAAIQNGSGSSDIVFKLQSPNGTVYYLHVSNAGVLSATTSP